jgi:hypothetical protein
MRILRFWTRFRTRTLNTGFYDVLFSAEFHEHIWTTCALLVLECNSDENIGFQIDLVRDIQELASNPAQNIRLSYASRYQESSIFSTV